MNVLDRVFHLTENNTSLRKELLGALTSFFAIAYIILVTPGYLSQTGMDYSAVLVATCVASALGCFISAAFGMPFMMTPGVGLNAFFTYTL
ncbi:MAG: NCS2 family permease, partial [Oscillospiraceae bacterium]